MIRRFRIVIGLSLYILCVGAGLLNAQIAVVKDEPESSQRKSLNEVRLNLMAPVAFDAVIS